MPSQNSIGKDALVKHHQDVPHRLLDPVVPLRQFLREDGAIFVSIDDNEVAHRQPVCQDIL